MINEKLCICEHVQVTGAIWRAIGDTEVVWDLKDRGSIYLADPVQGKDHLIELNNSFSKPYLPQARNGFVFIGEERNKLVGGNETRSIQVYTDKAGKTYHHMPSTCTIIGGKLWRNQ